MFTQIFKQFSNKPKRTSRQSDFFSTLYPEDVRYALSHKEAQLGKIEMRSLLSRFVNEAVYLVVKALVYDPEKQRAYLENLTRIFMDSDYDVETLRSYLREQIDALPDDVYVGGNKLAQLSRAGSDYWQQAFRNLAEQCIEETPNALPCIVAHTPMLGYRQFVDVFKNAPLGKMQLLVPEWMLDPDEERMGYEITLHPEISVISQTKHECLYGTWVCMHTDCPMQHRFCETAVFIDDTIHTGTTAKKLTSFWTSEYGLQVPSDRIRVITDLRDKSEEGSPDQASTI